MLPIKIFWKPNPGSPYTESVGRTPFGVYLVILTKTGIYVTFNGYVISDNALSMQIAKDMAQADFEKRLSECYQDSRKS